MLLFLLLRIEVSVKEEKEPLYTNEKTEIEDIANAISDVLRAVTGAVSALKTVLPSETLVNPFSNKYSSSIGSKPPSGPTTSNILTHLSFF